MLRYSILHFFLTQLLPCAFFILVKLQWPDEKHMSNKRMGLLTLLLFSWRHRKFDFIAVVRHRLQELIVLLGDFPSVVFNYISFTTTEI